MNQSPGVTNAERFADTAYSAELERISLDYREKLQVSRAQLAARGAARSSMMVRETARINGECAKALLEARLRFLLEGYDLYRVTVDDQVAESTVKGIMQLRGTLVSNAIKTFEADPVTAGFVPTSAFSQELEQRIGVSANWVRTQIDRRRLTPNKSDVGVTNIYHIHGHNPRWVTNGNDLSVNIVITSSDQIFANLHKEVSSRIPNGDEQRDILEKLEALKQAQGSGTFGQRYAEFIGVAANHMVLIAPFIPALTEMLKQVLR